MPSPEASPLRLIVGRNLDRAISEAGRTNRSVAEAIGATEHQVWRWRTGRHEPTARYLVALAETLFDGDVSAMYAEPKAAA